MKMNKLITTAAVLALIGVASVEKASAFSGGDLMLDFRLNDATSTGTSLEFDLGSANSFNFAQSNAVLANVNAGLTAVYGSGWASATDLVYSLVAANSNSNMYVSNPLDAATYNPVTLGQNSKISGLTPIYNGAASTLESDGSYAIANSQNASYANVIADVNGTAYANDYNVIPGGPGATESAIGTTTDLDKITTTHTLTDEGTFEVNTSGQLILNPVAVPEPASYVLGGIAAVLFVIMHRRSKIRA